MTSRNRIFILESFLIVAAALLPLWVAADEPVLASIPARVPFTLTAPFTLSGEWRTDPYPGVHPTDSRNFAQIRILTVDKQTGAVTGEMDLYTRVNRCGVGATLTGTFDGTTLLAHATVCDGRHPELEIWKEQDGFRGTYGRRALYLDADR